MTILIVDDNERNRYQLQVILGASGYRVVTAANGVEALATARQDPPDLIVSDILMPTMDGFALCREWRKDERLRRVPFVFYTATYTDARDRELALSLGAERFLTKPEDQDIFVKTLQEVIRQVQCPSVAPSRVPIERAPGADDGHLKPYSEALIRRLEAKMHQLEQARHELEQNLDGRKQAEQQMGKQIEELRRWHEVTLGREMRVIELKREVNTLLTKAGQPARYGSVEGEAGCEHREP